MCLTVKKATQCYKHHTKFIVYSAKLWNVYCLQLSNPVGCLRAEIAGLNPAWGINISLLWVLCVASWRSLCCADPLSRGVLPTVVCHSLIYKPHESGGHNPRWTTVPQKNVIKYKFWSTQFGLASHNAIFIETVTSQMGDLTNKTTFTTYFQTLMFYLNPSNGIM